jgi:translocation and assembly module TamB
MRKAAFAVIVVVLAFASGIWMLGREATLVYAAHHLVDRLGGRLELDEVRGSLLGEIRVAGLRFRDEFGQFEVNDAGLRWRPLSLLIGRVNIAEATAKTLVVELASSSSNEPPAPPRSFASPLSLAIGELAVETLSISRADTNLELHALRVAVAGNPRAWEAELKSLVTRWGELRGEVTLGATEPFALEGEV